MATNDEEAQRAEEEARRAKENAEKLFVERDYNGACSYALRAQMLCPTLEGIAQMTATFHVYAAAEVKLNGEADLYAILGIRPTVLIKNKVMRKYHETSLLLHPNHNKTLGADGAFRLHSEAWETVSDLERRTSYDIRRNSSGHSFWTICTACHVQYEYLRKYHNKKLSCKNCRGIFVAIEIGIAPPDGAYAYNGCQHFPAPETSHANQHIPITSGVAGSRSGQGRSNRVSKHSSFHRGSYSGSSSAIGNANVTAIEAHAIGNGNNKRSLQEPSRMGRPSKRKRIEGSNAETASNNLSDMSALSGGNGNMRSYAAEPNFDSRSLLLNRAQSELRNKLEEIRKAGAEMAALKRNLTNLPKIEAAAGNKSNNDATISGMAYLESEARGKTAESVPITVPDSDFHDFDNDRTEECFKAKQIWAVYDAEDGMPRLYCTIRQVISLRPFQVVISYMNSKTDSEFGSVKWIESGFTKSCGKFRTWKTHVVDQVNIFSHLLNREKTRRGGCLRIYPRAGEIWAIYKNWSPDWSRSTPKEVRRDFEMVEILDDYDEEGGVCMNRVVKVEVYNTVYGRKADEGSSICRVSKKEMLRFSHRVPCWRIRAGEGTTDLPAWCWDLDPAATISPVPSSPPPTATSTATAEMIKHPLSPQLLLFGLPAKHHPRVHLHRHADSDQRRQAQAIPQFHVRSPLAHHLQSLEHVHDSYDHATVPHQMVIRLPVFLEFVRRLRSEHQRQRLHPAQAHRREP